MTLYDLTGQNTGIILLRNTNEVGVYNWAECGEDEMPMPSEGGFIPQEVPGVFDQADGPRSTDDIVDELPVDMVVMVDYDNVLPALMKAETPTGGVVWPLADGTIVIAPDNWA